MEKQQDRIRIKDIAQMAGVSVGTVDRVLHSRSGVSESSRIKVEEILKKLNYQPNMYASALASNKKYRFAYLLPSHNEGDYWKDVERGMQQAITRFSDFNVSLSDYYYDQYESGAFIESGMRILEAQPDGVILSPTVEEETERFVSRCAKPAFRMYLLIRILLGWSRWLSTDSMPSGADTLPPACCVCWLVANRKLLSSVR